MQGVPETKGWAELGSEASRTEGSSWSRALLLPCPHSSTCNVKCLSLSPPQASLKAPGSDCFQYQSDSSSLTMKDLMLITSINMFRALISKRKKSSGQPNMLPLIKMFPLLDAPQVMQSQAPVASALHLPMEPTQSLAPPSGTPHEGNIA